MGEPSHDWSIEADKRKSCNKQDRRNWDGKENKSKVRYQGRIHVYEDLPGDGGAGNKSSEKTSKKISNIADMSVQTDAVNCTCLLKSSASPQHTGIKSSASPQHFVRTSSASPAVSKLESSVSPQHRDSTSPTLSHQNCSSEESDQISKLLTQEEVPAIYWQEMVEMRRDALNDSLKENETLREAISKLKCDIAEVTELAEQEDYFKNMIQVLTDEPDFGEEEEEHEETDTASEVMTDKADSVD